MRKSTYDSLPLYTQKLRESIGAQKDYLIKAVNGDIDVSEGSVASEFAEKSKEAIDDLCKKIYSCFLDLKEDFYYGSINLVVYRKYLDSLHELLTGGEKITNKNLNADKIAAEIKKFTNAQ